MLVRHVVREKDEVAPRPTGGKRQAARTREQFLELARENQVDDDFEELLTLEEVLPATRYFVQRIRFAAKPPTGKPLTVMSAFLTKETHKQVLAVYVPPENLAKLYSKPLEDCRKLVQELQAVGSRPIPDWGGWPGVGLATLDQTKDFVRRIREFLTSASGTSTTGALQP